MHTWNQAIFKGNSCFSVFPAVGVKWEENEWQTLKTEKLEEVKKLFQGLDGLSYFRFY